MKVCIVADDVIVESTLPHRRPLNSPDGIDSLRRLGFELTDDCTERPRNQRLRRGDPLGRP